MNSMLFPTVEAIKDLVMELKKEYGDQLIAFLDFHGHSVKRNIFSYGPEFPIYNLNYYIKLYK